jgi:GT2 family glycosyltransferase
MQTTKPSSVQIYVLSRDRPHYLREALNSICKEREASIEIIISDNSEGNEVQHMVEAEFPRLTYVRRYPPVSAMEHFRIILCEVTAQYFVLFHDDDVMMDDYAQKMVSALRDHPEASAVACNALFIHGDKRSKQLMMGSFSHSCSITNPQQLLKPYLEIGDARPAPFPGYMYRSSLLGDLHLDPKLGGKYADVSFLTQLVQRGPIVWIAQPLMYYRLHQNNDSKSLSVAEHLRLLRYLIGSKLISRHAREVWDYRFKFWLYWWTQNRGKVNQKQHTYWVNKIVGIFLLKHAFQLILNNRIPWKKLTNRFIGY